MALWSFHAAVDGREEAQGELLIMKAMLDDERIAHVLQGRNARNNLERYGRTKTINVELVACLGCSDP